MGVYALIKEKGATRLITDLDVCKIIEPTVRESIIAIIDFLISKYGESYVVRIDDVESLDLSCIKCGNIALSFIKKMIGYKNRNYYGTQGFDSYKQLNIFDSYKQLNILDLKMLAVDYPIRLDINSHNFDFVLKELGEIKVANNLVNDSSIHRCGDCAILSPLTCEKAEYIKKDISEYSFITDGFQIYSVNDDGEEYLEKFIILKCKNLKLYGKEKSYYEVVKNGRQKVKTKLQ